MRVLSSGGVIINNNLILLLKKYNGDYVLPKGRIERGESIQEAALREVKQQRTLTLSLRAWKALKRRSFTKETKQSSL